jgi:glycosyltransferase involved in cell wall biosynthesis
MLRISFVEPHLELYGGIRRVMELSNRLVRLEQDVTIYHPTGEPCEWMEGEAKVRPLSGLYRDDHDVIIFNDPPDYRHVRRAKAALKVFYILCLYDREQLKKFSAKILWPRKGRMMSLKRALQMPFVRMANATWMQRYLRDELHLDAELLIGGVNRDMFHPVRVRKTEGAFNILCSGDPRERKGMETIRRAVDAVMQKHPNVRLDTYYGKAIPQEKMAETYASADLFLDAQRYAGWNNPVAEAMACGVPVVCTDIGAVADFAFHEETALLVPVGDAGALAAAVERMIGDEALRRRLKSNALNKIAGFDWDRSARRLVHLLEERLAVPASRPVA